MTVGPPRFLTVVAVPNRDRQTERREATRREILHAAWDVAREQGLATLTLREIATRVGMRPPSLYSHFASKNAIYDAMYGQAWQTYLDLIPEQRAQLPSEPRAALKFVARLFFDFAAADLARHQLMTQRTIPGFTPSHESYAIAVEVLDELHQLLDRFGIRDPAAPDLYTALVCGLVDQQWANDPGGDRWRRLLDRAIDMYADEMGLPGPRGDTP